MMRRERITTVCEGCYTDPAGWGQATLCAPDSTVTPTTITVSVGRELELVSGDGYDLVFVPSFEDKGALDDELARLAFDAYALNADGQTHDGREIPEYGELGERVQANWRAAARAIRQVFDGEVRPLDPPETPPRFASLDEAANYYRRHIADPAPPLIDAAVGAVLLGPEGDEWSVVFADLGDADGVRGWCNIDARQIVVSTRMSRLMQYQTLVHETVHAIEQIMGGSDALDEELVEGIAYGVMQVSVGLRLSLGVEEMEEHQARERRMQLWIKEHHGYLHGGPA